MVRIAVVGAVLSAGAGSAFAQGALTNGADAVGAIASPGQTQTWTFTASQGDGLVLTVIDSAADPVWAPFVVVRAPDGSSLGSFGGPDVGQARLTASQTGTYSVAVGANPNVPNGIGPYILRLAKAPGSYTVPGGDQGGDLTNGEDHPGTITLGDLDLWSFHAQAGDALVLTVADQGSSLGPYIQIWGPNGASMASGDSGPATQLAFNAPLNQNGTGTYTVLISANVNAPGSTGNYILRLARAPASFVVPSGDQGGDLTNGQTSQGTITRGDLDLWRFAAGAGAAVSLTLTAQTTGLQIRVVGTNGAVLAAAASGLVTQVNLTALPSGIYTVVISAYINAPASTSNYTLLATGIQNPSQPPAIGTLPTIYTAVNTPIGVTVTLAGGANGPTALTLFGSSSNQTVVPNANLVFSGSGASRLLTITPAVNRSSVTTITLNASDGSQTATTSFVLVVGSLPRPGDFDGDHRSEVAVFRPSTGTWYIRNSGTGLNVGLVWGGAGDIPVPGDYDFDGLADMAVFRPSNGTWYLRQSSTFTMVTSVWGGVGDVPVPGDYDADGRTDIAVFRTSSGIWYIRNSATGLDEGLLWGGPGDVPVPGDYDADGKTDMAVFRPATGTWYLRSSATGTLTASVWGGIGDIAVAGDYDGDGRTDIAVFRASSGIWYIRNSRTGLDEGLLWGGLGDVPVPGDYDADGKTDMAVFRPSTGTWYIRSSINGALTVVVWGGAGDIPVLRRQ